MQTPLYALRLFHTTIIHGLVVPTGKPTSAHNQSALLSSLRCHRQCLARAGVCQELTVGVVKPPVWRLHVQETQEKGQRCEAVLEAARPSITQSTTSHGKTFG